MSKKKNLELDYYYYHYGNRDADYFISDVLSFKDYKTFMRLYNSPDNGIDYYLPDTAVFLDDAGNVETRNITMKRYFDKITYFESEHGLCKKRHPESNRMPLLMNVGNTSIRSVIFRPGSR